MAGLAVSAAVISMRPSQRAHWSTSTRKTRQMSDAHGCRLGCRRREVSLAWSGCDAVALGAECSPDGTIRARAANAGANTPNYAERSIMRSAA